MGVKKAKIVETKYREVKKANIIPIVTKNVLVKVVLTNIEKEERRRIRTEAEVFGQSESVDFIYELEDLWVQLQEVEAKIDELEVYIESIEQKIQWYKGEKHGNESLPVKIRGTSRLFSVSMLFLLDELGKIDRSRKVADYLSEEELLLWQIHIEDTPIMNMSVAQLVKDVLLGEETDRTAKKQLLNRLLEMILELPIEDGYEVLLGERLGLKSTKSVNSKNGEFLTTVEDVMLVFQYVSKQDDFQGRDLFYDGNDNIMGLYMEDENIYVAIMWKEKEKNRAIYTLKALKKALFHRKNKERIDNHT